MASYRAAASSEASWDLACEEDARAYAAKLDEHHRKVELRNTLRAYEIRQKVTDRLTYRQNVREAKLAKVTSPYSDYMARMRALKRKTCDSEDEEDEESYSDQDDYENFQRPCKLVTTDRPDDVLDLGAIVTRVVNIH